MALAPFHALVPLNFREGYFTLPGEQGCTDPAKLHAAKDSLTIKQERAHAPDLLRRMGALKGSTWGKSGG